MSELNIYQKIQLVSNEVKNIEKNMIVGAGSYAYKAVQDIDVVLEVKRAEKKYGLVSIPIKQELVKSEIVRTVKSGGIESIMYMDIIKMTLRIVNVENTSEYLDIESFGRGLDVGDKGFGKAATYARKYALLNAYKIATGEDPDKNKSEELTVKKVDEKRDAVSDYLIKNMEFAMNVQQHFGVHGMEDLTDKQIDTIYNNLKKKALIQ